MINQESEILKGDELHSFLNSIWTNDRELLPRLEAYAVYKLSPILNDPTKKKPLDLVHELVAKFYSGERKTKRGETSKMKEILFGALKSHISNYLTSKSFEESNHTFRISEQELLKTENCFVESMETTEIQEQRKNYLFKKLAEHNPTKIEVEICECWLDQLIKPADICDLLSIESKDYTNARKRLLNKLRKISS